MYFFHAEPEYDTIKEPSGSQPTDLVVGVDVCGCVGMYVCMYLGLVWGRECLFSITISYCFR